MKQYKHIPTGKIAKKAEITGCYFVEQDYLPNWLIENSSDWEEVKPKEYEILKFQLTSGLIIEASRIDGTADKYLIHTVKRLSDSEVFCVGDKVKFPFGDYPAEIKKIIIVNDEGNDVVATISEGSLGKIALCVDRYVGNLLLNKAVKANQPLFTTKDGVEIFKNQKYFGLYTDSWLLEEIECGIDYEISADENLNSPYLTFSTKEAAEAHRLLNKPCLSVNDIIGNSKNTMKSELIELAKTKIQ